MKRKEKNVNKQFLNFTNNFFAQDTRVEEQEETFLKTTRFDKKQK